MNEHMIKEQVSYYVLVYNELCPCNSLHFNKDMEVLVDQSCLTLYDPMDCTPLASSIHGIFQARILEWVAISLLQKTWKETHLRENFLMSEKKKKRENFLMSGSMLVDVRVNLIILSKFLLLTSFKQSLMIQP